MSNSQHAPVKSKTNQTNPISFYDGKKVILKGVTIVTHLNTESEDRMPATFS